MADILADYEVALQRLLERMGPQQPAAAEAGVLQLRLLENSEARRRGQIKGNPGRPQGKDAARGATARAGSG